MFPSKIFLGGKQASEFAYFIISGKCNVVREMVVVKKTFPSGKSRYFLPPINNTNHGILPVQRCVNKKRKVERKLLVIRSLNEGDYFGVGEGMDKTYIITAERVSKYNITKTCLSLRSLKKTL
jgi:hypothetical protein